MKRGFHLIRIRESTYDENFETCSLLVDWFDNTPEKDYRILALQDKIPDSCLYHEYVGEKEFFGQKFPIDIKGKEDHPHITIAIGLDENEIKTVRQQVAEVKIAQFPKFNIGIIKFFRTFDKPYDVMYLDIISPFLIMLNACLRNTLKSINNKFIYRPHLCLAYVKKDVCIEFDGLSIEYLTGDTIDIRTINYYLPTKKKYVLEV